MSRKISFNSSKTCQFKLTLATRIRGIIAVALAYCILRLLKLNQIIRMLHLAKGYCSREIDAEYASVVWEAVRQADFYFPGRLACMELSLAFVIFALTKRTSVKWCVGVKIDPFESHAWVEIGNKPFGETEVIEQEFKKVCVV